MSWHLDHIIYLGYLWSLKLPWPNKCPKSRKAGDPASRLTDVCAVEKVACVFWCNKSAVVAQIGDRVHAGSYRKLSGTNSVSFVVNKAEWDLKWSSNPENSQVLHISSQSGICGVCWINRPNLKRHNVLVSDTTADFQRYGEVYTLICCK